MGEPVEVYRDPQIDELLEQLRILSSDLCDIRWALYRGSQQNSYAIRSVGDTLSSSMSELRRTIQQTFVPWYLRLWYALRRIHQWFALQRLAAKQRQIAIGRVTHLRENAWRVQMGRFRSRYL